MSRYDSRATDPGSHRDRRSDGGFGGGSQSYGRGFKPSGKREAVATADLDGLVPFEKNFYVESPSVAAMTEDEVEAYRRGREITVDGHDDPKPVREFQDVGFPGSCSFVLQLVYGLEWLLDFAELHKQCLQAPEVGLIAPDLVIFLDVPPEKAAERGGYGTERYEQLEFQKKVAEH